MSATTPNPPEVTEALQSAALTALDRSLRRHTAARAAWWRTPEFSRTPEDRFRIEWWVPIALAGLNRSLDRIDEAAS